MSDNFDALKDNEFSVSEEGLEMVSGGVMVNGVECFIYRPTQGDSLPSIAKRFKTTVDILCALNKIPHVQGLPYDRKWLYVPEWN